MFAFFGVYWSCIGWPLAAGLVVSIYIHEMGHVMIKRLGHLGGCAAVRPGLGALVMLKQHVDDPVIDARIGLAGPCGGSTPRSPRSRLPRDGSRIWGAIAQLGGFMNLFNLFRLAARRVTRIPCAGARRTGCSSRECVSRWRT